MRATGGRSPGIRRIVAMAGVAIVGFGLVGAAAVAALGMHAQASSDAFELPRFETVRSAHRPSDRLVLDRNGRPIAELRVDYTERRGRWVPLEAISPALQHAVLISEDHRFYAHGGVDWRAVAGAAYGWLVGGTPRGASTVSMQLVAMLDPSLQRPRGGRGLQQKWHQAQRAWQLESAWSKDEILEAYLNLAAFRGELRGVDALARVMFGKHPHGLAQHEAMVAAALLRGPNASAASVTRRACALHVIMRTPSVCPVLAQDVDRWMAAIARPAADAPMLAMHFARFALSGQAGGDSHPLITTLDAALQETVIRSVSRHLAGMSHAQLTDAAVVVLENDSGEVLAYLGASAGSTAGAVDHVRARRQAGSTLKPFLYAMALELRYLTAASLLNDAPLDVATGSGLYIPSNYDSSHAGWISVRTALASSLNIPAVRTLMLLGPERFADRLRRLGLPLMQEADHYGYSLSLGSADVDLLSLTNAYRSLALGLNVATPVVLLRGGPELTSPQAMHSAQGGDAWSGPSGLAAWVIGDVLSDRRARARTFGLENALSTRFWSAVKTGTSKDMRDNWTIGWSGDYTVGVWVGNSEGMSMRDVSGVSGAAPIWHEVMAALHSSRPSVQPPRPQALEQREVAFEQVSEARRVEYFLPGTALDRVQPAQGTAQVGPRIVAPVEGTVVALDPDMPAEVQRLLLRADGGIQAGSLRWHVGKQMVGQGPLVLWSPRSGTYTIVLSNEVGHTLDERRIQVRGLPRAAAGPELAFPGND